jgi:hypothetical protein
MRDPFGWHEIDRDAVEKIRQRLVNFESMTWPEILIRGEKRNHRIPIPTLCKEARDRLRDLRLLDEEHIVSLGVGSRERIFGFLHVVVLDVLWWDPDHGVCPSYK